MFTIHYKELMQEMKDKRDVAEAMSLFSYVQMNGSAISYPQELVAKIVDNGRKYLRRYRSSAKVRKNSKNKKMNEGLRRILCAYNWRLGYFFAYGQDSYSDLSRICHPVEFVFTRRPSFITPYKEIYLL